MLEKIEREGSIGADHSSGRRYQQILPFSRIDEAAYTRDRSYGDGIYIDTDIFFTSHPTFL
jgi:hypothetical protein